MPASGPSRVSYFSPFMIRFTHIGFGSITLEPFVSSKYNVCFPPFISKSVYFMLTDECKYHRLLSNVIEGFVQHFFSI